jgi:hypothetical protein
MPDADDTAEIPDASPDAGSDFDAPLTDEDKRALIDAFEADGFATFILGVEREGFDVIIDYVRRNKVPTLTDVDHSTGTVTITKRPFGSLEFG